MTTKSTAKIARAQFRQLLSDEVTVAQNIQSLVTLGVINDTEGNQLRACLRADLMAAYQLLP